MDWTIRSLLAWSQGFLNKRGSESPRLDAELLLAFSLSKRRIDLYLDMDRPMDSEELGAYRVLIKRRAEGEPVAYIRGQKGFYGHSFFVDPHVLIPRPETEILVERAVDLAPMDGKILEVGVGSGAVIISILKERQDLAGVGSDISLDALRVTRDNAKKHGVKDRLMLFMSDLAMALNAQFDLIVINPPYVALRDRAIMDKGVRDYEPMDALFAGNDGLDIIKRVLMEMPSCMKPGARCIMEAGYNQAEEIEGLVKDGPEVAISSWERDLSGMKRAVILEKING
ncbi:MAG: peptide chain release factor N(5)-glutamine methyltransferase [Thermodesulfobacteriota bacterium]|nr:peptide chain release factor N(5)-glutamine methyltransferase [Thermodesulfobacteriota bacterium]